jgi:hypothetical protein
MKDADENWRSIVNWTVEFAEQFNQGCLELVEEVEYCLTEAESAFEAVLDPIWQWLDGLDRTVEETSRPMLQTLAPAIQNCATCIGCRHYCGETYGGNTLVCAMHPYGAEGETCPDWESTWPVE